jgi:hypothetical protein
VKPTSLKGKLKPIPPTEHICSICHLPYGGFGNNAYPFTGRCCDDCNATVVIPERLALMHAKLPPQPKNGGRDDPR